MTYLRQSRCRIHSNWIPCSCTSASSPGATRREVVARTRCVEADVSTSAWLGRLTLRTRWGGERGQYAVVSRRGVDARSTAASGAGAGAARPRGGQWGGRGPRGASHMISEAITGDGGGRVNTFHRRRVGRARRVGS